MRARSTPRRSPYPKFHKRPEAPAPENSDAATALSWGVLPVLSEQFNSTDVLFYHALRAARDTMHLQPGDNVVMTGGITNGKSGNTNLIKIEAV